MRFFCTTFENVLLFEYEQIWQFLLKTRIARSQFKVNNMFTLGKRIHDSLFLAVVFGDHDCAGATAAFSTAQLGAREPELSPKVPEQSPFWIWVGLDYLRNAEKLRELVVKCGEQFSDT